MKPISKYKFKKKTNPYKHKHIADIIAKEKYLKKFNTRLDNLIAKYPNHFSNVSIIRTDDCIIVKSNNSHKFNILFSESIGIQLAQVYDYVRSLLV